MSGRSKVGGDFVRQGDVALNVRGVGLFGGGEDPVQRVLGMKGPAEAAARLRAEEQRRLREIRSLVLATVNAAGAPGSRSAGSAASIDLSLHIVRQDFGAEIANAVARSFVVPPHRDGGQGTGPGVDAKTPW